MKPNSRILIFRYGFPRIACVGLVMLFVCGGCQPRYNRSESAQAVTSQLNDTAAIYTANRNRIRENAKAIREVAKSRGWQLKETGTGLFYQIIPGKNHSEKSGIRSGDRVTFRYRLELLNGTPCYSSDGEGPKSFVVDNSEAASGLHEAVKYMNAGDSAIVVLPPHLAFGLTGDGDKVPPQAVVVYKLRVVSVESKGTN